MQKKRGAARIISFVIAQLVPLLAPGTRHQGTRNKNNQNHARGEIIDFFLEITEAFGLFFIGPISQHKHKQY
jgi:hypothetical protein